MIFGLPSVMIRNGLLSDPLVWAPETLSNCRYNTMMQGTDSGPQYGLEREIAVRILASFSRVLILLGSLTSSVIVLVFGSVSYVVWHVIFLIYSVLYYLVRQEIFNSWQQGTT